ncbi:MAG: hypothetical protein M3Z04_14070 [Chloroflexota bacterium]|nr:hypothetical protein [Chloroflexota bacterium]
MNPPAESQDRSFLARYGAIVLRGGIAAFPAAIFQYQAELALSPQEVWFMAYILARKWSTSLPRPSLRRMAERSGYSEQQLHRIKNGLIHKGYLTVVERYAANGGQAPNGYDFGELFGRLEALLMRDSSAGEEEADEGESAAPRASRPVPATGHPPTNIYVSAPANKGSRGAIPPNTAVSPPLTSMLVAPLTAVLDEEEARQPESNRAEPPPPPAAHIPTKVSLPVVGVDDKLSEQQGSPPPAPRNRRRPVVAAVPEAVQDDTAQIVAAGLATAAEAQRLAQISYDRQDQEGYVTEQIQHALSDPALRNRAAAFKANVEAGREFVPPPAYQPRSVLAYRERSGPDPSDPSIAAACATTDDPVDPPAPAESAAPGGPAACAAVWQQATPYLRALCPTEYATTLRYVTLAALDPAGGTALLTVPNTGQRRAVERLAAPIALALQHAGQPALCIQVATHPATPLRPTLVAPPTRTRSTA